VPIGDQGRDDIRRAAEELVERVPRPLAPLARLAYNYRWSWLPEGHDLYRAIDPDRFGASLNPVRLLQEASAGALARAAADEDLIRRAAAAEEIVAADLARPPAEGPVKAEHPVAFFCAEFGVHASLPVYSGGLGALAGDLLKEASDRALPMVGVGLMYAKGYFRQRVDAVGWQHEYWIDTDPWRLPAALVTADNGEPVTVSVTVADTEVAVQIWRVDVGRVPLFLLDADIPANGPLERWITARLYEGDTRIRLAQYALLGIGGVRALRALGIDPGVIHLNEGHAAFAPLAFAASTPHDNGLSDRALAAARARTIFTTHTPVPAGNDTYPGSQVESVLAPTINELGIAPDDLLDLGRTRPGDGDEEFGMTQAALRLSRAANGVSARHGRVARSMWKQLWPARAIDGVPIGHVTNGVHLPTWIGAPMRELLERTLGEPWLTECDDPEAWAGVDEIPPAELWAARETQRSELISFVRGRSVADRLARGDTREYVQAVTHGFDEKVLTIGFARRVATYKRLDLLTRDPDWTANLLGSHRPMQIVLAGKAHPRDDEAKHVLQRLFGFKYTQHMAERVVYLDDYDLATAAQLVRGCDVWLNLPRPPLEASGTSGMKSAINGGLQLSVLDGWWAEAYDGSNGWALPGEVDADPDAQDRRDAETLHLLLADTIVPAFYERDEDGIPTEWVKLMRSSLRSLGPRFCATRMLNDYIEGPYRRR
jgi:starch phosphorylase